MKFFKNTSNKAGVAPGTLVYVGKDRTEPIKIQIIDYDENNVSEKFLDSVDECCHLKTNKIISWINVDGIHDVKVVEKLGECFDVHPLVLEDMLNCNQRPKVEYYDNYIFIVVKMITYRENENDIDTEQISMIIGNNYLITFQEKKPGDVFEPVRQRIKIPESRLRKSGVDLLAYALLDAIIDNYFIVLDKISNRIEDLEEDVMENPNRKEIHEIYKLRRTAVYLRRMIWPLREITSNLSHEETDLIDEKTNIYFRDLYDHIVQILDHIESFRDVLTGLLEVYLSSISNRLNEIMKILTVFAVIFSPLTFLVGVYGMNFKHMPELHWKYSYPVLWIIMIAIACTMFWMFKRRKWL